MLAEVSAKLRKSAATLAAPTAGDCIRVATRFQAAHERRSLCGNRASCRRSHSFPARRSARECIGDDALMAFVAGRAASRSCLVAAASRAPYPNGTMRWRRSRNRRRAGSRCCPRRSCFPNRGGIVWLRPASASRRERQPDQSAAEVTKPHSWGRSYGGSVSEANSRPMGTYVGRHPSVSPQAASSSTSSSLIQQKMYLNSVRLTHSKDASRLVARFAEKRAR